ncbi:3-deoxy-D-manno-octulosonic acid transferase [Sungkyunkwania multivorans]|uniref:3-deoxy-D-manno-octulosonic acid transferase n=1 Tax=Sungkyunkwania multivorans TaxID=1173618 RepID=A0ABW3CYB7_9FLAO
MSVLYNIAVIIVGFALKIIRFFSPKIKLFVDGRKTIFQQLRNHIDTEDHIIWFHVASLGEFEQGLPVIEKLKTEFPSYKTLVTFFSPSGYEVKKHSKAADLITYLPLDTKRNVSEFLDLVQPKLAVFVKYEFWPNYLSGLRHRNIRTILISGIFRKEQAFFKSYGGWMRRSLRTFDHFFVQDENSKTLLNELQFENVSVSGDTRFDRVAEILERDNTLKFVEAFKQNNLCVTIGSSWPEDEALLVPFINETAVNDVKFIIAPHHVKAEQVASLKNAITKKTVLFSEKTDKELEDYEVLIIDSIGLLTKVYSYADIAYVGGGMGSTGLHNTLEPAVFGIPVVIGKVYENFKEAKDLVRIGGILSIASKEELARTLHRLLTDNAERDRIGTINREFTQKNRGATIQIMDFLRTRV